MKVVRRLGRGCREQCMALRSGRERFMARGYGEWVNRGAWSREGQLEGGSRKEMDVFGAFAGEYDAARPSYPSAMWDDILSDHSEPGYVAADVAAGTGRGAVELVKRGFNTKALDLDPKMLQEIEKFGFNIETCVASAEDLGLPSESVDVLVSLQAFHWFDAPKALQEFSRVLKKPDGIVAIAWNDRDLNVDWIGEMEDILEKFNPLYNREIKVAENVVKNGALFEESGHFKCEGVERYPNPVSMTMDSLLAQLWTFSYVRNCFGHDEDKSQEFSNEIRNLVLRHHGEDSKFDLPWVCKAFRLRPI